MSGERYYDTQYAAFSSGVQARIRRAAFAEDIGQNGWLSADEHRRHFEWLRAGPRSHVLDIACGSGGPALFMAQTTGCRVTGVDVNEAGIAAARDMAAAHRLGDRATFAQADGGSSLGLADGSFDGLVCIDAINHLADRPAVLARWRRMLKPNGRLVFTDPIVVTGILTSEEIAIRASIGFFLFTPPGDDLRLLNEAGYSIVHAEDTTARVDANAFAFHAARERYRDELIAEEGADVFAAKQRFFAVAGTLARERRLSRFTYVAEPM
jgi:SAM-dependent methyltransferase